MKQITIAIIALALLIGCVGPPQRSAQRIPLHLIKHEFDGREWKVGYQAGNSKEIISEWVVNNETVEDWNELLTTHFHYHNMPIRRFSSLMQELLGNDCPTLEIQIISEEDSRILFEWLHNGCRGHDAQREIRKLLKGTDGVYMLAYAVKEKEYSEMIYQRWMKIIMEAELKILK